MLNLNRSISHADGAPYTAGRTANESGGSSNACGTLPRLSEGFTDRIRHIASKVASVQIFDPAPERVECRHAIAKNVIGNAARLISFVAPLLDACNATFERDDEKQREWLRVDAALAICLSGALNSVAQMLYYRSHKDATAAEINSMTWMNLAAQRFNISEGKRRQLDRAEHMASIFTIGGLGYASINNPHDTTKQRDHENAEQFDRDLGRATIAAGIAAATGGQVYDFSRSTINAIPGWVSSAKQALEHLAAALTGGDAQPDAPPDVVLTSDAAPNGRAADIAIDIDEPVAAPNNAPAAQTIVEVHHADLGRSDSLEASTRL